MMRWEDVQTFPYDFKDIEDCHDVVVFTSEPLEEDLTVAGKIMAALYASTDVRDTDWWVHVSDVNPDGRSVRLTVGVLRARFRDLEDPVNQIVGSNFETEQLLSGNLEDVVRYEISIPSIANTFKKGHRIRIAVMNALDKYLFPNSNTGEHEAYVDTTVVGTMRIHHSGVPEPRRPPDPPLGANWGKPPSPGRRLARHPWLRLEQVQSEPGRHDGPHARPVRRLGHHRDRRRGDRHGHRGRCCLPRVRRAVGRTGGFREGDFHSIHQAHTWRRPIPATGQRVVGNGGAEGMRLISCPT